MSIDRTFFAFNEQRADAKWTELGTLDLKTLAAADQKKNELEDALRKITDEQRTAQTAEAYLHTQGIDTPSDALIFNTESAIESGEINWPPAISEEQNRSKKEIEQRISELPTVPPEIDGTNFLYALWPDEIELSWLKHERTTRTQFLYNLIELDLAFGSTSVSPENEDRGYSFMRCLLTIFLPEISLDEGRDSEQLFGENIVPLFERISKEKIYEALRDPDMDFLFSIEIDSGDLSWFPDALIDFALELRPLAKEVKNNGGRLIVATCGSHVEDPYLLERAKRNFEFLVNKFPWINDLLIEKS